MRPVQCATADERVTDLVGMRKSTLVRAVKWLSDRRVQRPLVTSRVHKTIAETQRGDKEAYDRASDVDFVLGFRMTITG